ncbi:EAL domain-containing response regulator [Marinobacterium jannaschii]|uniref:EAL domain-containing response regulator n=1 Tax=Marinobacterium jannaschii TaxID=64970 RepID=UPI00056BE09C|nr:EAL domain-containing response regulator [Marinobacterium jannaschii]
MKTNNLCSTQLLNRTVLVVDDEPFVLRTTSHMLKKMGFGHISTAESVAQARQCIADAMPPVALALVDLNMPDVDGVEFLRHFEEINYQGFIILISGEDRQTLSMAENLGRRRGLSVLGALNKPVSAHCLQAVLKNLIAFDEPARRSASSAERPEVTIDMLERAIDAGELEPWFQPKIDLKSLEPVGVEALVRWPTSGRGMIYPDEFIPVAERSGLIDRMTFLVVEKALKAQMHWQSCGLNLSTAINISMDSLQNLEFPDSLGTLVSQLGGEIGGLHLEVTESQLAEDLARPLEVLLRLRLKKVRLSIDDFGTGHSNLTQLRDLPFDELKLDRSYVQEALRGGKAAAILESSVELAKKLGMTVVAEGVETLQEWRCVERLGCDQVQGYFAARPMPAEELPLWVNNWAEKCHQLLELET